MMSLFSVTVALPVRSAAAEIDACKSLIVTDLTGDPSRMVTNELRKQARTRGFDLVSSRNNVPATDSLKTCLLSGNLYINGLKGVISVQVVDGTNALVGEATASGTVWVSAQRSVRVAVEKIYSQLGYTGFDDRTYRQRLERQYPKRPTVATSEDAIKNSSPRSGIEGIWADPEYTLGIVPAPPDVGADYVAVILRSQSPLWQLGEIKAEIRRTGSREVFTGTYFMGNKHPQGITFTLDHDAVLRGSPLTTPTGTLNLSLVRVWPELSKETASAAAGPGGAISPSSGTVFLGTGFLLAREGLIATNWHVVADATKITIAFPGWREALPAEVAIRDKVNDLAILRVTEPARLANVCQELPYQLTPSTGVTLGQQVSTVGYPLTSLLGSSPKFSEGVVSSKNGLQDDPRNFQISAQVQPGSSGSPLFDTAGHVVGIVVATLDPANVYKTDSALPQNVNFAVKSDYLLNLVAMLPAEKLAPPTTAFSAEKAASCVGLIQAQ